MFGKFQSRPPEYPPANLLLRSIAYLLDMALLLIAIRGILGLFFPAGMEEFVRFSIDFQESVGSQGKPDLAALNQAMMQLAGESHEFARFIVAIGPLSFLVLLFYFTLTETFLGGATLGKKTFNLRTAYRDSPRIPPLGQLFIRSTIKSVTTISMASPFLFLLSINFLLAFIHRDRKCLHDYLTRTSVVPGFLPEEEAVDED